LIYEQRIYKTVPGKLPAINARFANHTIGFFEEFEIGIVGFWNDEIGASNQLTYILSFDSMADREQKWAAFGAHKPWQEVRAETEKDGPIVAQVINSFMSLTPYSPQPSFKSTLHEKRVYEAMPGKLPDLHNRFSIQSHHGPVRKARYRECGLLDRGRGNQQPAGLLVRLPRLSSQRKRLVRLSVRPGLAKSESGF